MAIWQDLVDDHVFPARYASVRRFVLTLCGGTPAEARVVITTAPGEEGQTDYGEGPMVRDPNTGKYRRVRLFVFTLGYSRKSVRLLTWRSSAQIWAALHERAFRRIGGTPLHRGHPLSLTTGDRVPEGPQPHSTQENDRLKQYLARNPGEEPASQGSYAPAHFAVPCRSAS
jgi:hypothetical protein